MRKSVGVPGSLVGHPRAYQFNSVGSSLTECIHTRKDVFLAWKILTSGKREPRELAAFDENRRAAVRMLNPVRAIKMKARTYRGGGRIRAGEEKGRHLGPRLVQEVAEGKTSNELSWIVKAMIKNTKKNNSAS